MYTRSPGQPENYMLTWKTVFLPGIVYFTTGKDGEAISYITKGKVQAYVQFKQPVPEGFERINLWPAQLFDGTAIPEPETK